MWEDPGNVNGGRWLITLNKHQRNTILSQLWLETIMTLVGNIYEQPLCQQVCGAVVNVRPKQDKISLWTSDSSNARSNIEIG